MIVDEATLAPLRDADGLCHVSRPPPLGGPRRYADVPATRWPAPPPPTLFEGALTPTPSEDAFPQMRATPAGRGCTILVLGFLDRVPPLPPGRRWLALEHVCGGLACRQVPMIATPLTPRPAMQAAFDRLAAETEAAAAGRFFDARSASEAARRCLAQIAELGFSCGPSAMERLCEALYPLDATAEALERASEGAGDLAALLARAEAAPTLLVLAQNSD